MKKIEAIVRPEKVSAVCAALEKIGHPGVMISEIEGHGRQKGLERNVLGKTYKVDLLTKARIEVIVKEADLDKTVKAVKEAAYTGQVGDGKIFISTIDETIRIRTGENSDLALV
jgi:nitrogen regulatory protein P-II 1